MSKHTLNVHRILDANLNRAKEGLRVCEEVCRFVLEDATLTRQMKALRHSLEAAVAKVGGRQALLKERRSLSDVGERILGRELKRSSLQDVLFANLQRAKESVRVLEEFSKLSAPKAALAFKTIRYKLYEIEKKTLTALTLHARR